MKHLKQKLMAAVAMLLVSSVMLTSASFAWFSISTAPEVKNVTATVTTNQNLEIALGKAQASPTETRYNDGALTGVALDQTWGALVTNVPALTGLGPVEADGATLKTVKYGVDGRPSGDYHTITINPASINDSGYMTLVDDSGNVVGQAVLLWLRTNVEGNISVEITGTKFNDAETNKALVKVAFQQGTASGTGASSAVTLSGNIIVADGDGKASLPTKLAANVATPVMMYIYLDGPNLHNEHVATAVTVNLGTVTFRHSSSLASYTNN